ncbi:MAG: hypothetical protein LPK19_02230, partial [Hymenobacteraceae bacterium]|nr:hypothetical protein [Hymenobacteraceae bacterium]MDX5394995.1 hypothetical protein [Hymenobacteraceae bacterium]MDX5511028.1 hypothetical protein [Hymenobacteraceae bacterium]
MKHLLRSLPRPLVLGADLLLCFISFIVAYLLRFNFDLKHHIWHSVPMMVPIVLGLKLLAFWVFRTYAGILKYSSTEDFKKIFAALSLTNGILLLAQLITNKVFGNQNFIPISVIVIDYIASLSLLSVLRIAAKTLHYEWYHKDNRVVSVIIYGAGDIGLATQQTLIDDAGVHYKVVAFLDDDPKRTGKYIGGVRVEKATERLKEQLLSLNAELLILAAPAI